MPDLRGARVLVVEDHAFQRANLVGLVRAIGIQHVSEASNGREALAALEANGAPVAVILCDLEMPEMDGIQFLRAVAERKLAHGVIIISAREAEILASVEAMVRSQGLAVLGKLGKPFVPEELWGLLSSDPEETAPVVVERVLDPGELRRAIEAGEVQCEFQPKVNLATGEMIGVEALARLRLPGASPVGPNEFVPAVVRAGLIIPLTTQVLDASCRALVDWDQQGLCLTAAVNLSMSALSDLGAPDRFAEQVRARNVDPRRITFEVTETEVMSDPATVLNVLARMRLKGFRLAIDDFGTGYASLAQLNTMPFTELKIDRTFVRNCGQSQRLRNIVRTSLDLARRLNMRTVAEGIESLDEWDFLRLAACDEGQGYYIARPMAGPDVPAFARQSKRRLVGSPGGNATAAPIVAPAPGRPAPVDDRALQDLTRAAGRSARDILGMFCEGTARDLAALGDSSTLAESGVIRRAAHGIKGAARMIGARELSAAAARLEIAARDASREQLEPLVAALNEAFLHVKEYAARAPADPAPASGATSGPGHRTA